MKPQDSSPTHPTLKVLRHRRGSIAGAGLTVILGLLLLFLERALPLDTLSNDLVFAFRKHHVIPQEAVIVYLDENSLSELQKDSNRLNRRFHAQLVDRLGRDNARAVIFDILFYGPSEDPAADEEFTRAIRQNGKVILAGENLEIRDEGQRQKKLFEPYAPFKSAAAGWGTVQLAVGQENAVRRHLHDDSEIVPSLSWAAAEMIGAPHALLRENRSLARWINYYGEPGSIPNVSFHQAIGEENGVAPGFFKNKVVFIGAQPTTGYTGTAKDEFKSPLTFWTGRYAPGVEIHATCFLNLVHGDWLTRMPSPLQLGLVILTGALAGFGLVMLRPFAAAGLTLFSILAITLAACFLAWRYYVTLSWLVLVMQCAIAFLWALIFNSIQWYVQREFMLKTLSTHLSPARAKVLMGKPELLRPGAELQCISILFTDIANFSKIAEKLPPNTLAELLNRYFEASISCIHQTEGTVVKLIGDAIFAIWNAPESQENHHYQACRAALLLQENLLRFDAAHKDLPQMRTRVGLHTGMACVGNFGSSARFDYTAIGDSVNLSSRLEGLNKFLGTEILVSDAILGPVADRFDARSLGRFQFKGFERFIEVFELLGIRPQDSSSEMWRTSFARALQELHNRNLDAAEDAFRKTVAGRPDDGPSVFYLEQIAEFRKCPPPENWSGEIELKEK